MYSVMVESPRWQDGKFYPARYRHYHGRVIKLYNERATLELENPRTKEKTIKRSCVLKNVRKIDATNALT